MRSTDVTFRFIADPQAQVAAMKSGDVDAFPEFGAPELTESFQSDPTLRGCIGNTELKVVAGMNNTRKPFDDKRVRKALMMAIDRQTVVDGAWSGLGQPIGSHYTPNDPGYVDLTGVLSLRSEEGQGAARGGRLSERLHLHDQDRRRWPTRRAGRSHAGDDGRDRRDDEHRADRISGEMGAGVLKAADYDMTIVAHAEPMDIDIYARDPYYFNYKNPAF